MPSTIRAYSVPGNDIWAASPSLADVQAAIAIASPGDTVRVPAGSATWTSQLVITGGIILILDPNTVITNGYGGGRYVFLVYYHPSSPSANEPFRLTGGQWNMNNAGSFLEIRNDVMTPLNKIRLDHYTLYNAHGMRHILIALQSGPVYGVMDNVIGQGSMVFYGNNETAWGALNFAFGSADNFYVEDSVLEWLGDTTAGGAAGRYCFRHNAISHISPTSGIYYAFDAHGNQGPGTNLSQMGMELYENTITITYAVGCGLFDHRGGKGLVFNNNIISSASVSAQIREEYNDNLNPPTTSPDGQPQHVSDSYYFNNTQNGSAIPASSHTISQTVDYGGEVGLVPQWDVDCWRQTDTFDGSSGVGVGLLAARPATCTTGVGYWATDENKLYRATSTNVWTLYYTPYTYPHPLRT